MTTSQTSICYRDLETPADMDAAVALQKIYWGEDMGALVPAHMLLSIVAYGGHVLGAYDGDRLVGLLIGFLGYSRTLGLHLPPKERLLVMSKRMVVLPEYRGANIGTQLKLMQRDFARRHGIALVTWTFDPLLARNAYLNLYKLGAVGQRYEVNYFGASQYNMISGDRLVVNWWVEHPHAAAHIDGRVPRQGRQDYEQAGAFQLPALSSVPAQALHHPALLLEIPAEFPALAEQDAELAQRWRDHVRQVFDVLMPAGYLAANFIREDERTFYVFTRDDGTFTFMNA